MWIERCEEEKGKRGLKYVLRRARNFCKVFLMLVGPLLAVATAGVKQEMTNGERGKWQAPNQKVGLPAQVPARATSMDRPFTNSPIQCC